MLKISGEALAGDKKMGVDNAVLKKLAEQIKFAVNDEITDDILSTIKKQIM